jgi:hypothetical protein
VSRNLRGRIEKLERPTPGAIVCRWDRILTEAEIEEEIAKMPAQVQARVRAHRVAYPTDWWEHPLPPPACDE